MKKKLIALITALTLCAGVVVGTTLAYYSAETDEVTNTFTYSPDDEDPDPKIEEPNWPDDPTVTPGTAVPKDPQIVLTSTTLKDDQEFYAAMVIRGSTIVTGKNSLKEILKDGTAKIGTKEVPDIDPVTGERRLNPDGSPKVKTIDVFEDVGLAKLWGWSDKFEYEVNPTNGDVYAYYKTKLSNAAKKTDPVFQAVITNSAIDSILKDMKIKDQERFYDIYVQGYVVSSKNDTEIKPDGTYGEWGSSQKAMRVAFPDIFTNNGANWPAATNPKFPYTYPNSLPSNTPDFQPNDPFLP